MEPYSSFRWEGYSLKYILSTFLALSVSMTGQAVLLPPRGTSSSVRDFLGFLRLLRGRLGKLQILLADLPCYIAGAMRTDPQYQDDHDDSITQPLLGWAPAPGSCAGSFPDS